MAISYVTLIDVARVNGIPLPELYPILIDMGTVATMIAAAQFRLRGVSGRWLAYTLFILLSAVSIVANATHAWRAADLTLTSPWAAAVLAATPPAALLGITHLVMMLIPDEKDRAKIQAMRERAEAITARQEASQRRVETPRVAVERPVAPQAQLEQSAPQATSEPATAAHAEETVPLRLVDDAPAEASEDEVRSFVLNYTEIEGKRPTGKLVGEWLGKTPKTGQRFLKKMEDEGAFEDEPQFATANVGGVQ